MARRTSGKVKQILQGINALGDSDLESLCEALLQAECSSTASQVQQLVHGVTKPWRDALYKAHVDVVYPQAEQLLQVEERKQRAGKVEHNKSEQRNRFIQSMYEEGMSRKQWQAVYSALRQHDATLLRARGRKKNAPSDGLMYLEEMIRSYERWQKRPKLTTAS
jgi:hypothetical protein